MVGGCIPRRPFPPTHHHHENDMARALVPAHWSGRWARSSSHSGGLLLKKINLRNATRSLRYAIKRMDTPAGNMYSPHCLRRGAAQELKESPLPRPIVASVGQRYGVSFGNYISLSDELSGNMLKLLMCPFDFNSVEQEGWGIQVHWRASLLPMLGYRISRSRLIRLCSLWIYRGCTASFEFSSVSPRKY